VQSWISKKHPKAESVPKRWNIDKGKKKCFISFFWQWVLKSGPHACWSNILVLEPFHPHEGRKIFKH
jgi:hypothetical protein